MNVVICPDCSALVADKKKHALSHSHPPSGEWIEFNLQEAIKPQLEYETLDEPRNA
jgi:hypothetical protein